MEFNTPHDGYPDRYNIFPKPVEALGWLKNVAVGIGLVVLRKLLIPPEKSPSEQYIGLIEQKLPDIEWDKFVEYREVDGQLITRLPAERVFDE